MARMREATFFAMGTMYTISHELARLQTLLGGSILGQCSILILLFLFLGLTLHGFLFRERVSDLGSGRQLGIGLGDGGAKSLDVRWQRVREATRVTALALTLEMIATKTDLPTVRGNRGQGGGDCGGPGSWISRDGVREGTRGSIRANIFEEFATYIFATLV